MFGKSSYFSRDPKILMLCCALLVSSAHAAWNQQHEEGWHWYQDPEKERSSNKKHNNSKEQNSEFSDPLEEIASKQQALERSRAEAILRPSEVSVQAYIEKQIWATNQADRFSQVWDAVMRLHPELDYNLKYPSAQFARHIYLDQQKLKVKQAIQTFKEQYGFFFFFRGDCPYCHALAPIVETVVRKHGIQINAVSLDGAKLKEYPQPLADNGISKAMKVYSVPAIFAVNPKTNAWFPIVTGAISVSDLEERILAIAQYLAFDAQGTKDVPQTESPVGAP